MGGKKGRGNLRIMSPDDGSLGRSGMFSGEDVKSPEACSGGVAEFAAVYQGNDLQRKVFGGGAVIGHGGDTLL